MTLAGDVTADTIGLALLSNGPGGGKLDHKGNILVLTGDATSYLKPGSSVTKSR